MTEQHRITPPPSLVEQWCREYGIEQLPTLACFIADKAAEWSSDQELEACEVVIESYVDTETAELLRNVRRPKSPSLKQQALEGLKRFESMGEFFNDETKDLDTIRRALEALPDD